MDNALLTGLRKEKIEINIKNYDWIMKKGKRWQHIKMEVN